MESDDVNLKKTLKVYHQENRKAFKFTEFRNVVKDNQKWKKNKTSDEHIDSDSKRSRTSESDNTTLDARVGINFNDDELVRVIPPSQPMGRDKEKHKDKDKDKEVDSYDLKVDMADYQFVYSCHEKRVGH